MSGIKIGKTLKSKIVDTVERANIEQLLKQKAQAKCFLCNGELNYNSDDIEADHDVPESEGGETNEVNLNLVHLHCNRFKGKHSSLLVKK